MRLTVWVLAFSSVALAEPRAIDPALAGKYFREAREVAERDGRAMWGVDLAGPMLLVDRATRSVVASHADREGRLHREGEVFIGTLPPEQNIANTAVTWAGVKWTMIAWPLPENRQPRVRLMLHELFHRIQDQVGLPAADPANRHLDTPAGRAWLRLEWRALERALEERGPARRQAVADALAFRRHRHGLCPGSAAEEAALETHEGMAEYTGLRLSARSPAQFAALAAFALRDAQDGRSFGRSFAYASGPAYGALLDSARPDWRKSLEPRDDLGEHLGRAFRIGARESAELRAAAYDGDEILAAEARRETLRAQELAKNRARFIEGPVVVVPLSGDVRYSYDPNQVASLTETGMIYATLRVTDDWGILEAEDGALLIREGGRPVSVRVAAPVPGALAGPGWKLELGPGWTPAPGERRGDYVVRRIP